MYVIGANSSIIVEGSASCSDTDVTLASSTDSELYHSRTFKQKDTLRYLINYSALSITQPLLIG